MQFSEILELFFIRSGRADLVDPTTYADTGAGYYINAGQKWLDSKLHGNYGRGRHFKALPAGEYLITIPEARVIEEVWIYDSLDRSQLTRKTVSWLKKNYTGSYRSLDRSTPYYYAHEIIRHAPDTADTGSDTVEAGVNMMSVTSNESTESGLLILPPPDSDLSVEIVGKFFTTSFVEAADTSWWSEMYPEILVWSALRQLEIDHRNTQGVNDWTNSIMEAMREIDNDQVEQETGDITEIGD